MNCSIKQFTVKEPMLYNSQTPRRHIAIKLCKQFSISIWQWHVYILLHLYSTLYLWPVLYKNIIQPLMQKYEHEYLFSCLKCVKNWFSLQHHQNIIRNSPKQWFYLHLMTHALLTSYTDKFNDKCRNMRKGALSGALACTVRLLSSIEVMPLAFFLYFFICPLNPSWP